MIDAIPYQCAEGVNPSMLQKIIRVESSGNPFAIGVVGGRLERQPKNLEEAVATVELLEKDGFNYSIGISQVNRIHFERLGWKNEVGKGFDVCANLKAGAGIFRDCYAGALRAGYAAEGPTTGYSVTHASLSCYYSGRYQARASTGYVAKVLGTEETAVPRKIPFRRKSDLFVSMFD